MTKIIWVTIAATTTTTLRTPGKYNKPNNSSVKNCSLKIHAPLIYLRRDARRLFSQASTEYNCNILRATNNSNKHVMQKKLQQ